MGSNSAFETLTLSHLLNVPIAVAIIAILVVLIYAFPSVHLNASTRETINDLGGLSIIHAWNFFSHQYDFIQAQFKKNGNRMFRFKVLKVRASRR